MNFLWLFGGVCDFLRPKVLMSAAAESGSFQIPSTARRGGVLFKPLYTVETTRFKRLSRPKVSVLSLKSDPSIVVAIGADTKLHVVQLCSESKEMPEVQKYEFKSPITGLSMCSGTKVKFSILVVMKDYSMIIQSGGLIINLGQIRVLSSALSLENEEFIFYGGTDEGGLVRAGFESDKVSPVFRSLGESGVAHLQLCPSHRMLGAGLLNGTVSILRSDDFEMLWTQSFRCGAIRCMSWNNDDHFLGFAGEDDNFFIVDCGSDFNVICFTGHDSFVNSVAFDFGKADSLRVFSSAEDSMIGIWEYDGDNATNILMFGPCRSVVRYVKCLKKFLITVDSGGGLIC
jgi:hypothetical protein